MWIVPRGDTSRGSGRRACCRSHGVRNRAEFQTWWAPMDGAHVLEVGAADGPTHASTICQHLPAQSARFFGLRRQSCDHCGNSRPIPFGGPVGGAVSPFMISWRRCASWSGARNGRTVTSSSIGQKRAASGCCTRKGMFSVAPCMHTRTTCTNTKIRHLPASSCVSLNHP